MSAILDHLPRNLPRALHDSARRHPERTVTLLDGRGRERERRRHPEVLEAAELAARRYRALGLLPGDRVMICLSTSFEWFDCWLGALLCDALPAAIATPGALGSPTAQVEKALRVAHHIGARFLIGSEAVLAEARRCLDGGFAGRVLGAPLGCELLTAEALLATAAAGSAYQIDPDSEQTAFLQLTSGSTGLPRAVEISHRAVLHNLLAVEVALNNIHGGTTGAIVSWLPLYHDMGLVGCVLNSLVNGRDLHLMSPRTFLGRPWIWLEQMARLERVLSPGPNFAYQLCVERIDPARLARLDLRNLRDAVTGSEMVRPETVGEFLSTFERCGFTARQMRTSYGLAEATVAVTLDQRMTGLRVRETPGPEPRREVASTGSAIPDTEIEIRDPAGSALGPLRTGSVWIRGPGLFSGYYQEPEATAEVLRSGWLDSGDLGFLDADGELYITGRKKEILILQGHNMMPHELEWIAEGVLGAGGSERSGAFSVSAGSGEQAVLVLETTDTEAESLSAIARDVSRAIGRALQVPLADLMLVRRGSIPRTSSGKIQRTALREAYLRGELERLDAGA